MGLFKKQNIDNDIILTDSSGLINGLTESTIIMNFFIVNRSWKKPWNETFNGYPV